MEERKVLTIQEFTRRIRRGKKTSHQKMVDLGDFQNDLVYKKRALP